MNSNKSQKSNFFAAPHNSLAASNDWRNDASTRRQTHESVTNLADQNFWEDEYINAILGNHFTLPSIVKPVALEDLSQADFEVNHNAIYTELSKLTESTSSVCHISQKPSYSFKKNLLKRWETTNVDSHAASILDSPTITACEQNIVTSSSSSENLILKNLLRKNKYKKNDFKNSNSFLKVSTKKDTFKSASNINYENSVLFKLLTADRKVEENTNVSTSLNEENELEMMCLAN